MRRLIKLYVSHCARDCVGHFAGLFAVFIASTFAYGASQLRTPPSTVLKIGGGTIAVHFRARTHASIIAQTRWIENAAQAVSGYFDRFPVEHVTIEVVTQGKDRLIGGTTWFGRKIELRLGELVGDSELLNDWTPTHEMFHLAFPQTEDNCDWMGEGLATYLEPLARARLGYISAQQVWRELSEGLVNGEPKDGDLGLDRTHTWGRIYWGGAGFWFLADLLIREQTQNKKSLDDAICAILKAGGDGSQTWSPDRIIATADKAVGLNVFSELHKKMAAHNGWENFETDWKKLGLAFHAGQVIFNDKAPLAQIRLSMTAKTLRPALSH